MYMNPLESLSLSIVFVQEKKVLSDQDFIISKKSSSYLLHETIRPPKILLTKDIVEENDSMEMLALTGNIPITYELDYTRRYFCCNLIAKLR